MAAKSNLDKALDAFIEAPDWSQTRTVLEANSETLLTLEACVEVIRRLGHATRAGNRRTLSLCARVLVIAQMRDIETAWRWLDMRHQQREQFKRLIESLAGLPQEEAAKRLEEATRAMSAAESRLFEDMLTELAEDAAEAHDDDADGDDDGDEEEVDSAQLEAALRALLQTTSIEATLDVLEQHAHVLLTKNAVSILRANAKMAREDKTQSQAQQIADFVEMLATLADDARRTSIAAVRQKIQRAQMGDTSAPPRPEPLVTPPIRPNENRDLDKTRISLDRAPTPTEEERAQATVLLSQEGIEELVGPDFVRALKAWLGVPGFEATDKEKAQARADLHEAMGG